jgi:hypothetical protein
MPKKIQGVQWSRRTVAGVKDKVQSLKVAFSTGGARVAFAEKKRHQGQESARALKNNKLLLYGPSTLGFHEHNTSAHSRSWPVRYCSC